MPVSSIKEFSILPIPTYGYAADGDTTLSSTGSVGGTLCGVRSHDVPWRNGSGGGITSDTGVHSIYAPLRLSSGTFINCGLTIGDGQASGQGLPYKIRAVMPITRSADVSRGVCTVYVSVRNVPFLEGQEVT